MTDNFVGFSPSPKADPDRQLVGREFSITSPMSIRDGLSLIVTESGMAPWLGEIHKFDFRQGAKLKYSIDGEAFGATFALIQVPKRIVLVTESLGEADFRFKELKNGFELKVNVKMALLDTQVAKWSKAIDSLEHYFRSETVG